MHAVLSRTLAHMASNDTEEMGQDLQDLFAQTNVDAEEAGLLDLAGDKDWEAMISEICNIGGRTEQNLQEINRKRRKLTFQTFADPTFIPKCILLEYFVGPLSWAMDKLMARSSQIASLQSLLTSNDCKDEALRQRSRPGFCEVTAHFPSVSIFSYKLMSSSSSPSLIQRKIMGQSLLLRSMTLFKAYMNGEFGHWLIKQYLEKLRCFHSRALPINMSKNAFILGVLEMGECWRRFVYERDRYPFKVFALLDCESDEQFIQEYLNMRNSLDKCPLCMDLEFTAMFLAYIPGELTEVTTDHTSETLKKKAKELRLFLEDCATFIPLSSDTVECLHGFQQSCVHTWRGRRISDWGAQKFTLWRSICASYKSFFNYVWDRHGDKQSQRRQQQYGRRGCNQYTAGAKTIQRRVRATSKGPAKKQSLSGHSSNQKVISMGIY